MGARYGQHFLVDDAVVAEIIADCPSTHPIIEIGPGSGALTHSLLGAGVPLLLIEIDSKWHSHWENYRDTHPHLSVIRADVLTVSWEDIRRWQAPPYTIVSNLPYEISGPFLIRLARAWGLWGRAVLMLQEEIVQKLLAAPGSRAYGRLSIQVQRYCDVVAGQKVPPSSFSPPPKVDSQCVLLYPKKDPIQVPCERVWEEMLATAFSRKRQMLRRIFKAKKIDWDALGIDATQRPEDLDLAAWARLCAVLSGDVPETGIEPVTY